MNSTLYNGWRHLFFIYPSLIFLSVQTFNFIKKKYDINFYKYSISIIVLQIIFNSLFIFKSHPLQSVYFNYLSKNFVAGNLPIDYWGLGNKQTIDSLLQKNNGTFLNISTASYTDLNNIHMSNNKHNLTSLITLIKTKFKKTTGYKFVLLFVSLRIILISI